MAKFENRRTSRSGGGANKAREEMLEEVVNMLRKGKLSYEIRSYLQGKVQSESEIEEVIDEARLLMFQKKAKSLPLIHTIAFAAFVLLSVLTLVGLFVYLPKITGFLSGTVMSILGTALFFLFVTLSLAFYKSWKPEKEYIERPRNFGYGLMFLVFLIPGIILAFSVSWRYDNVQRDRLVESYDYSIGKVTSGQKFKFRIKRARMNVSNVRVVFMTREGERIDGKYDVPESWHYYLPYGQKVLVKYCPEDPTNFNIIFDEGEIAKYTSSEERLFTLDDFLALHPKGIAKYSKNLEKVAFGWMYLNRNDGWINLRHNLMASRTSYGVSLRMSNQYKQYIVEMLKIEGFERDTLRPRRLVLKKDSLNFSFDRVMDVDRIDMIDRMSFSIE